MPIAFALPHKRRTARKKFAGSVSSGPSTVGSKSCPSARRYTYGRCVTPVNPARRTVTFVIRESSAVRAAIVAGAPSGTLAHPPNPTTTSTSAAETKLFMEYSPWNQVHDRPASIPTPIILNRVPDGQSGHTSCLNFSTIARNSAWPGPEASYTSLTVGAPLMNSSSMYLLSAVISL